MDKKWLIGGIGAVATIAVVTIAVTSFDSSSENRKRDRGDDQSSNQEISEEDRKKIEDLRFEEWSNPDKYAFCEGETKIFNDFKNPVLGIFDGFLNWNIKELLLFNKESQKFYVLTSNSSFVSNGTIKVPFLDQVVPFSEQGTLVETYPFNSMPVKIFYDSKTFFPVVGTEENAWVFTNIGGDDDKTSPHSGCAGYYSFQGELGDQSSGSQFISIYRSCDNSLSGSEYTGTVSFVCNGIDSRQARNLFNSTREQANSSKKEAESDELDVLRESSSDDGREDGIRSSDRGDSPDASQSSSDLEKEMRDSGLFDFLEKNSDVPIDVSEMIKKDGGGAIAPSGDDGFRGSN